MTRSDRLKLAAAALATVPLIVTAIGLAIIVGRRPAATTQDWAAEAQSWIAAEQLVVAAVLAWITGIYAWQNGRLLRLAKANEDRLQEERDRSRTERRRALIDRATDDIDMALHLGADAKVMAWWVPIDDEALTAVAVEIGPRPEAVAQPLLLARRAIRRYNLLADIVNHGRSQSGAIPAELGRLLEEARAALRDLRPQLAGMRAALFEPQASGVRWYDDPLV